MKTIKCDRCGKEIPYVSPYMNAVKDGTIPPIVIMTVWEPLNQKTREIDLCDKCQIKVYDYIFQYNNADYNERIMRHDK